MTRLFFIGLLLFMTIRMGIAQELEIPESRESFYIAGISPFILDRGDVEASLTTSLLSYWNVFNGYDQSGEFYSNIYRLSVSENIANVSYGFSDRGKWDLGAEFRYTFRRFDDEARSSPFRVFEKGDPSFRGLSYLGVRFRLIPFDNIPNWTVQSSVLFPQADKSKRASLGADRTQVNFFTTYYAAITPKLGYFLQGGWGFHLPGVSSYSLINAANAAAFLSFNVWNNEWFLVPGLTYSGAYDANLKSLSQGVFALFVLQWQIGTKVSLNFQQGLPLLFESDQPAVSFERSSFSSTALGVRFLFEK